MGMQAVADALARLDKVLRRRPETGLSADAPAQARWQGPDSPLRVVCRHPKGNEICTDMPVELAGSGDQVSPGWLYRAALASCATTSIVLLAATEGVALAALEVEAESRSDAGGLIGLRDDDGRLVSPAPIDQRLMVRLRAHGATPDQLRSLVQRALQRSPIPRAVTANGLAVQIDIA
jgi:uncharacterized OsmC-like protein